MGSRTLGSLESHITEKRLPPFGSLNYRLGFMLLPPESTLIINQASLTYVQGLLEIFEFHFALSENSSEITVKETVASCKS